MQDAQQELLRWEKITKAIDDAKARKERIDTIRFWAIFLVALMTLIITVLQVWLLLKSDQQAIQKQTQEKKVQQVEHLDFPKN